MSNLSIRKKLLLSFQVIIVITALAGVIGLIGLNRMWQNEMEIVTTSTNRLVAKDLEINLSQQNACYNAAILDIDRRESAEGYIQQLYELDSLFLADISYLEENIIKQESKEYAAAIAEVYRNDYTPKRDLLIAALWGGDAENARRLSIELEEVLAGIHTMGVELSQQGAAHMDYMTGEDTTTAILLITVMSIITILAITLSILLGSFLFQAEQDARI